MGKYVITRLYGGLGNQLFQYAAGLSLAARLNADLLVHAKRYKGEYIHPDSIFTVFPNLKIKKASFFKIFKLLGFRSVKFLNYFMGHKVGYRPHKNYFNEPHYHFSDEINLIEGSVYINGYFQSERYFSSNTKLIKNTFIFDKNLENKYKALSEYFEKNNCVSVHIRRGDYLSNPAANKVHGVLSQEYYEKAFNYIYEKVKSPKFIFFSDDIDYVERIYGHMQDPILKISVQQHAAADDLYLMSKCKHHVIANSSFSWWGAWLSELPDKVVITPKEWFSNSKNNIKDLIPEGWVRL